MVGRYGKKIKLLTDERIIIITISSCNRYQYLLSSGGHLQSSGSHKLRAQTNRSPTIIPSLPSRSTGLILGLVAFGTGSLLQLNNFFFFRELKPTNFGHRTRQYTTQFFSCSRSARFCTVTTSGHLSSGPVHGHSRARPLAGPPQRGSASFP